jgi:uncharacterized phage protein (TIGR01671 family)
MRTTEFRGKNAKNEWVTGDLLHNRGETFICPDGLQSPFATPEDFRVDPATVGEFTGLADKNGRKIYEGDIFKTTDSNGRCLVVVEWDNENARFLGRDQRKRIWYVGREPAAEIIGNIHDNPELLKNSEGDDSNH